MSHLLSILKVTLINSLSINRLKNHKKTKALEKTPIVTGAVSSIFAMLMFVFYSYMMASSCVEANMLEALIIYGVGSGGSICLLLTFARTSTVLFQSKDFDLLNAMPIKTSTIALAKFLNLLLINYIYFNSCFIIPWIFYLIYKGFSYTSLILGIVIILTGPFFPTTICAFVSYMLSRITERFKFKKSVYTFLMIAFIVVYLIASFKLSYGGDGLTDEEYNIYFVSNIIKIFRKYFLSFFCANAFNGDIIYLVYYLLISFVPLFLFVYLYTKSFVKICSYYNVGTKNSNFSFDKEINKENKKNSVIISLIKREFKLLFSSTSYLINAIIGPIISVLMTVIICTKNTTIMEMMGSNLSGFVPLIIILASAITMGISPSSNCALSIEGKSMWILKTSPLSANKVLLSKTLIDVIICIPFILINAIITNVLLDFDIMSTIMLILVPIMFVSSFSFIGMWINVRKPNFNWINQSEVIKQDSGVLVTMLVNFAINVVVLAPSFLLEYFLKGFGKYYLFVMAFAIMGLTLLILLTNGVKKYERMEV